MPRRLISSTRSQIHRMTAAELKTSIRASEGRVLMCQTHVGLPGLIRGITHPEMVQAFGADMIMLNVYSTDPNAQMVGLQGEFWDDEGGDYVARQLRLPDLRPYIDVPIGVYFECGSGDDARTSTAASAQLIRADRVASEPNLRVALEEGADFIVLGGNPGTSTKIELIIEATKRAKAIVGDDTLLMSGKWEDGVFEKVLGDPTARRDGKEVVAELIDAGADVINFPMPGSRQGVTMDSVRELIEFAHTYRDGTLALCFLDGSVEGADEATVRECTLMSRMAGADIHVIGDAGLGGISVPEDIMQMSMTIKGRRLTWTRLAAGRR